MAEIEKEPTPQNPAHEAVQGEIERKRVRSYRSIVFQFYLIVAVAGFLALALLASTNAYFPIDLAITKISQSNNPTWVTLVMQAISWPGYTPQAFILVFGFLVGMYLLGLRWEAVMTTVAGVGADVLDILVKLVVHRPRPSADLVHVFKNLTSYSFPSGHVVFYTGFFGFLWFLSFTLLKPSWKRTLLLILFGGLVVWIGFSRISLGEHWASDVLGGYMLGSLALMAAIRLYHWGKGRFFTDQPVVPVSESEKVSQK